MDSYDYVVVGAGSAGCVLARRLLDAGAGAVLLLEAGGADDQDAVHATDIASMTSLWGAPEASWPYETIAQPGLNHRHVPVPQGRLLGGGSSINAMMYVRGDARDFDHWNHLGNDGWSYEDVLPLFRRSESYAGAPSRYRGTDGPLRVIEFDDPAPSSRAFVQAAKEIGLSEVDGDYNGPNHTGNAFFYQSTRSAADRRCSTADAFLRPVLDHPDLTVVTGAKVRRVLWDGTRVVGVEYTKDGRLDEVAAGEVILSAGALATPQLLMLSGVGPGQHLRAHGIAVTADLPGVGQNLQDHLLLGVGYECQVEEPPAQLLAEAGIFLHTRKGMAAASPNLQIFYGPVQFVPPEYQRVGPAFTLAPVLTQPASRGTVTLRSANPEELPVVDPRYLESTVDLETLVDGIRICRDIVAARAFDGLRGPEIAPGADVTTEDGLIDYVRNAASTVWHPAGTCRMGRGRDAVVDPALRVRGVTGLRVADASVMPTITAGNTNAATIMIGEKAADLVLEGRS
jgi:choline dehydrogenase